MVHLENIRRYPFLGNRGEIKKKLILGWVK